MNALASVAVEEAYRPSDGEPFMNERQLAYFKQKLLDWKDDILRESRQFNAREFRILASQNVIDMFLDEESQHLAMLEEFIRKPISLQVETQYGQEQYDVILM